MTHKFGGPWTEDKLQILQKYLHAYLKIFKGNTKARYYTTHYVDAFAGTGRRTDSQDEESAGLPLFELDTETVEFQQGSATIAMELDPFFDKYLFIERSRIRAAELEDVARSYSRNVKIRQGEANEQLRTWVDEVDWRKNRAVVFLDPYGMQVEWDTIKKLASTGGVDLWLLFPLGQAVIRLLTKEPPTGGWADRLTLFFGTDGWRTAFYKAQQQQALFGGPVSPERSVNWEAIETYFVERLKTVFPAVSQYPRRLNNSMSVPLYLLFFASANKKGGPTALRIAQHLLEKV
jgi:three-Cys-motif partner protein